MWHRKTRRNAFICIVKHLLKIVTSVLESIDCWELTLLRHSFNYVGSTVIYFVTQSIMFCKSRFFAHFEPLYLLDMSREEWWLRYGTTICGWVWTLWFEILPPNSGNFYPKDESNMLLRNICIVYQTARLFKPEGCNKKRHRNQTGYNHVLSEYTSIVLPLYYGLQWHILVSFSVIKIDWCIGLVHTFVRFLNASK
jgi:hypothetical protein